MKQATSDSSEISKGEEMCGLPTSFWTRESRRERAAGLKRRRSTRNHVQVFAPHVLDEADDNELLALHSKTACRSGCGPQDWDWDVLLSAAPAMATAEAASGGLELELNGLRVDGGGESGPSASATMRSLTRCCALEPALAAGTGWGAAQAIRSSSAHSSPRASAKERASGGTAASRSSAASWMRSSANVSSADAWERREASRRRCSTSDWGCRKRDRVRDTHITKIV